ncbi:MAG: cytochrome C oxidase subunit II [Chitinophagales bacterium]|nr:cytochrome C oxidase subunit II [Bacteroidota bacterium]MCB9256684.1 cytochrome C oxidase subunit II [Chitinophagales bacterium]
MDKSEKIALFLGVCMLSLFFFAVLISAKVFKQDVPECITPDQIFTEGELVEIEPGKLYQLKYLSKMWAFEPAEVTIPVGSDVDIYLASQDVVHGFYLRGTNVNMMAVPGALNKKSMHFSKPGIYPIYCHEYCGTGHQFMKGKIIVTP